MPSVTYCLQAFLPALFATVAIICGVAGTFYCETFEFPHQSSDAVLFGGVWSYRTRDYVTVGDEIWVYSTCRNYNYLEKELGFDYEIDAKTRATLAFSIMAPIIGGIALIFAWITPCFGNGLQQRWKLFGTIFTIVSVLQGITLIMIGSTLCLNNPVLQFLDSVFPVVGRSFSEECEIGPGYRLVITSVAFWGLAGIYALVSPAPVIEASEPPQQQTVTYRRNEDGTVEETNVTIVKGSAVQEQAASKVWNGSDPETGKNMAVPF